MIIFRIFETISSGELHHNTLSHTMAQTKDNKTKNIYLLLWKGDFESGYDLIVGAFSMRKYAIEYRQKMKEEGKERLPRIVKAQVEVSSDGKLDTLYVLRRRECANVIDLPWSIVGIYSSMCDLENGRASFSDKDKDVLSNRKEYSDAYVERVEYNIEEITVHK